MRLGLLLLTLFVRLIGIKRALWLTIVSASLSTLFSVILFWEVGLKGAVTSVEVLKWFNSDILDVSWCFYFDTIPVNN